MTITEAWDADQELTISQAKQCLAWIERRAVMVYLNRSRAVSDAVRDYMTDNFGSSPTTRVEFEEAIRRIADRKYLEVDL